MLLIFLAFPSVARPQSMLATATSTITEHTDATLRLMPALLHKKPGFLNTNRDIINFAATLQDIDNSRRIVPANKLRITGNTLYLRQGLRYADIPLLLDGIRRTRMNQTSAAKIGQFPARYQEMSQMLAAAAANANNADARNMLELASINYFIVANLLAARLPNDSVHDEYRRFIAKSSQQSVNARSLLQEEIAALLAPLAEQGSVRFIPFQPTAQDKHSASEQFLKTPTEGLTALLKLIEPFIRQNYPHQPDLFQRIRKEMVATFKSDESNKEFQDVSDRRQAFDKLIAACNDLLGSIAKEASLPTGEKIEKVRLSLEHGLQQDLQRDFEAALYYWMMDDFYLKATLQTKIARAFDQLQPNLIVTKYLLTQEAHLSRQQRQTYYKHKGDLINASGLPQTILNDLAAYFPTDIATDIQAFARYLTSPGFVKFKTQLAQGNFDATQSTLSSIEGQDRTYALFALVSVAGWEVNNASKGSPILDGNYQADKFELSHLKSSVTKYNCMNISALNNYVLETLFGLESLGLNFTKYRNELSAHQTNAIALGDGRLLVADATNDDYFFIKSDGLDPKNTFDVDRYANAYMAGAYFNIHGKYARRYFNNPIYLAYVELTGHQYFEYLLTLQKSGRHNHHSLASRERMYQAMR